MSKAIDPLIICPHCGNKIFLEITSLWSKKYLEEFIDKSRVAIKGVRIKKEEKG